MKNTRHQLFRFALIGAITTLVHICIAVTLIEYIKTPYLWANFYAFTVALLLSFFGHYHWTFSTDSGYAHSFPKFSMTAIFGLSLNQTIMFYAVDIFNLGYKIGLLAVALIVPLTVFLLSKLWAFSHTKAKQ